MAACMINTLPIFIKFDTPHNFTGIIGQSGGQYYAKRYQVGATMTSSEPSSKTVSETWSMSVGSSPD